MSQAGTTRTLPRRLPDGWWLQHPRYRTYVMFAATGIVLSIVNVVLLLGVGALATSVAAWEAYLAALGTIPGLLFVLLLLLATVFFALRWVYVGRKIPGAKLGPMPAVSMTVALIANVAGLVTLWLVVLVLLSGVVV